MGLQSRLKPYFQGFDHGLIHILGVQGLGFKVQSSGFRLWGTSKANHNGLQIRGYEEMSFPEI